MYFKLKPRVGSHSQLNKKGELETFTAKEGKVIESDIDLVEKFPDKFELVEIPGVEKKKETPVEPEPVIEEELEDNDNDVKQEPLGKDRTKNYPVAIEEDLKVFYAKGKGYFVTEGDDEFTALNKEKLKKSKVEAFINQYLEA